MTRSRSRGFTLVELMIVLAVIAVVLSIAIPHFVAARVSANESVAVANLRSIASAQAQNQAAARADVDTDGLGEYGTLAEMGGTRGVRTAADGTAGALLDIAVLSAGFGHLNVNGEANRSGYLYRVFLPAQGGQAATEMTEVGELSADLNVDATETTWCVYAWPQHRTQSGNRAFFVNQAGQITAADALYSGTAAIEPANAGAAFEPATPLDSIEGRAVVGAMGVDGNVWVAAR